MLPSFICVRIHLKSCKNSLPYLIPICAMNTKDQRKIVIKEYRKLIKNWWNDHTKMKKIIQKNK